jgi:hypothetical protein
VTSSIYDRLDHRLSSAQPHELTRSKGCMDGKTDETGQT